MTQDIVRIYRGPLHDGMVPLTPPEQLTDRCFHLVDEQGRPLLAESFVPLSRLHHKGSARRQASGSLNKVLRDNPFDFGTLSSNAVISRDVDKKIHACHLIAKVLGGKEESYNLVPLPQTINERMTAFESDLRKKIDAGQTLYLQVFVSYASQQNKMASSILYRVYEMKGGKLLGTPRNLPIACLN